MEFVCEQDAMQLVINRTMINQISGHVNTRCSKINTHFVHRVTRLGHKDFTLF